MHVQLFKCVQCTDNLLCHCLVTEPRPVVLLGAYEAEIRRYLVEHGSNSDIKFAYCKKGESCMILS